MGSVDNIERSQTLHIFGLILLATIMPSKINLQSSDEKIFKEDLDVVKKSITIRTMLEDLGVENNETEDEVKVVLPLQNIDSEVLDLILQWCQHHNDNQDPEKKMLTVDMGETATKTRYMKKKMIGTRSGSTK